MNQSANALETKGITVTVDGRHLLEKVSCAIPPGKVIAVLGPNGAGKTTLLRALAGEWIPTEGEVLLNGKNLQTCETEALALSRAVLPQSSALSFPFTVEEVVLMGRVPHVKGRESTIDYAIALAAMKRVEVADLAERNYLTLSGGEKQRVHLARVLAQLEGMPAPNYLLLDEPAAALDLSHQWQLMRLLREQAHRGTGIFIILHDLQLAARHADELVVLHQGKMFAHGSPREVVTEALLREVFSVNARILSQKEGAVENLCVLPME